MRHWSQLATRNWLARPTRAAGVLLAISLGVAAVVWVTACFESVRRTVISWALQHVGKSHITVESPAGKYDTIPIRLMDRLTALPEVKHAAARLVQRVPGKPLPRGGDPAALVFDPEEQLDVHGIDITNEMSVREYPLAAGRMFGPDESFVCLLEAAYAAEHGLAIGDGVCIWGGGRSEPYRFEIVGLVSRRRIAKFQKGWVVTRLADLQHAAVQQGMTTSIDLVLFDSSQDAVRAATERVRVEARKVVSNVSVRSVAVRLQQIQNAQSQQELVLVLLSCVAMLTAMFIILSTLSMGAVERVRQLGLLRCVGLTGGQLGVLVLVEVLPLGAVGILLGIPVGLVLTAVTRWLVPDYLGEFPISIADIRIAMAAGPAALALHLAEVARRTGIATSAMVGMGVTLFAAMLPMLRAWAASPLEASRPRAAGQRGKWIVVSGAVGLLVLAAQAALVHGLPTALQPLLDAPVRWLSAQLGMTISVYGLDRSPEFPTLASAAIVMLYLGYALVAPLLVWAVSGPAVKLVAAGLRVGERLLQDQVGRAVWRSTGIACGLMVGLSLIVGLVVFSDSVRRGWEFPRAFPEAYVWNFQDMRPDAREAISPVPGVRNFTVAHAVNCIVGERRMFMERVFLSITWFLAIEPTQFLDLLRMEFVEGDRETAERLLLEGGHIIVAEDFSRTRNAHLGDSVEVRIGVTRHSFKVAGVIQSPALDIAASYFQAMSEANVVANSSVMGSLEDMRRIFGQNATRMVLLNFDLPPTPVPDGWPPPQESAEAADIPPECFDTRLPLERRWQRYREEQVLRDVTRALGAPAAPHGTARELKDAIDSELTRVTQLLAAVPTVALLVAAIGVANLMTASVTSRARQLAILRAVGATRGLILRMVLGEALVLGVVGTLLGTALGLHVAMNVTTMTQKMWGFSSEMTLPHGQLAAAVLLTVGLCAAAGIWPARRAARTNVVDALHVP